MGGTPCVWVVVLVVCCGLKGDTVITTSTASSFNLYSTSSLPPSTTSSLPPSTSFLPPSTTSSFIKSATPSTVLNDVYTYSSISFDNQSSFPTTERRKKDTEEFICNLNITAFQYQLQLEWEDPCQSKTTCMADSVCLNGEERSELQGNLDSYNVTSLKPYTEYNVTVTYDGGRINCSETETTNPAAPSKPTNLNITQPAFSTSTKESRKAVISWQAPHSMNGVLKQYTLTYQSNDTSDRDPITCTIKAETCTAETCNEDHCDCKYHEDSCNCTLELKPESNYSFCVTAENEEPSGKKSDPEMIHLTTMAGTPFFTVLEPLQYDKDKVTHYSITLLLNGSSISNDNGKVRSCEVRMQKGCDEKNDQIVYCTKSPPDSNISIVIGEGNQQESDCLPGDGNYWTSLEPKECYTFYVIINTTESYKISNSIRITTKVNVYEVAIYILLGMAIIMLMGVVGAYIIYTRRYKPIRPSDSIELPMVVPSPPDVSVERRILLSDLPETVEKLFLRGPLSLSREYADLRAVSTSKPCMNAKLPVNISKNRYSNILPFDETRVVLKEYPVISGSDFINASYIHGYSVAKEFIACQGPLNNTVNDFWRMVWEKNAHVIVMITQCIEKNKEKCIKYWPDVGKSYSFGGSTLKVRNLYKQEQHQDGFVYCHLQLSKRHKLRLIHHYQFVSWPDMSCPATPDQLINFVQTVKNVVPRESSHVVVHCSAGVGRTGTFIGLSNLMEEMCEQNSIDVFHTVYRMRLHRTNMVQTEVQYSFLYKCVLKYYLDQRGQSQSWPAIERRLEKKEAIPDVINGALEWSRHVAVDPTYSTISDEEEVESLPEEGENVADSISNVDNTK